MHSPRNWKVGQVGLNRDVLRRVEESKGAPIGRGLHASEIPGDPSKASNIPKEQNATKPAADQEARRKGDRDAQASPVFPVRTAITELATLSRDLAPRTGLCRNTEAAGGSRSLPQLPRRRCSLGECHGQNGRLAPVAAELIRLAAYCGGSSGLQALPKVIGVKQSLWWRG
jgi:hypothetical protein